MEEEQHTTENAINSIIKMKGVDTNKISDGYHTFGELYEHRIILYIALCFMYYSKKTALGKEADVWRTKKHSDGSSWEGWFVLGIFSAKGQQITYHLPIVNWDDCYFAKELEQAPEFDGHTSANVLERIKIL